MRKDYIVDNEYLRERGLDLNKYTLDGSFIEPIINDGLDLLVTRICYNDDDIKSESKLEKYLSTDDKDRTSAEKVDAFKKVQYRVIYNLIFQAEKSPTDPFVDHIIVFELGLGKINGIQKGVYYKNN